MDIVVGLGLIALVAWFFLFRKKDVDYPDNVSGGNGWVEWIKRFDPRNRG